MKRKISLTSALSFCTIVTAVLLFQTVNAQIVIPATTGLPDPGDAPGFAGSGPVIAVIFYFLNWFLSVFMLLAVISFVVSGIQYLMATGDQSRAEFAKRNFLYSTLAIAVVGGGLIIIRTIDWILDQ